ncbi:aroK [Symbiodinium necroappetens]|uniref:AroK protein n=1 Tax=Symbiodinium necroappetens TaxID=1628268 RepID=A0A812ILY4_9DINO|nr:aroK [Symbiodinium necroappetens]
MPTLYNRLNILKRSKREVRVQALLRTIPYASSDETDAMISELIEIAASAQKPLLLMPVFRLWEHASPAARSAVLGAVRDCMPEVIEALRASDDPKDARALEHVLLQSSTGAADTPSIDTKDPTLREAMDASLAAAAAKLPSEQTEELIRRILENAAHPGARLRAWLSDDDQPGHMTLRTAARKRPASWLNEQAVTLLGIPALAGVASSHIAHAGDGDARASWLAQWHLLMARGRRRALLRQADDRTLLELALTPTNDELSRRGGAIWLTSLVRNPARSTPALSSCFTDPSATVRHVAARGLRRVPQSADVDSALLDFAFDPDARVAETAVSGFTEARSYSRDEHLRDSYRALARSPHARVRRIATAALRRSDAEAELLTGDRLGCPIAARRFLARDRAGFVTWLKKTGTETDAETRLRAFALADRLCLLDELEGEIIRAIRSDDEYLVSKAALLIGKLKGPGPDAALRFTLSHGSDRVRANAVEAFTRHTDREEEIAPFLEDTAARVRGNAVRHFLKTGGGRSVTPEDALAEMLSDPRPGHRLSALWAAQSGVALGLAGRVDDISKNDPDVQVVSRAQRCSKYFGRIIRSGWSEARRMIGSLVHIASSTPAPAGEPAWLLWAIGAGVVTVTAGFAYLGRLAMRDGQTAKARPELFMCEVELKPVKSDAELMDELRAFSSLAKKLRLSRTQRIILRRVAQASRTPAPAMLLSERAYDSAVTFVLNDRKVAEYDARMTRVRSILIMGLRGAGKTTAAKAVADEIGWAFVDLDERAREGFGGITVTEIFREHGEPAFREAETASLADVLTEDRVVVALGGGTPTAPGATDRIRAAQDAGEALVIYLRAEHERIAERLAHAGIGDRPKLVEGDLHDEMRLVFEARDPLYPDGRRACEDHALAR